MGSEIQFVHGVLKCLNKVGIDITWDSSSHILAVLEKIFNPVADTPEVLILQ